MNKQTKPAVEYRLDGMVRPLREGELMAVYMDFDRRADKTLPPAEYLLRFAAAVSAATVKAHMSDLIKIQRAQRDAAEAAVVASISREPLGRMDKARAKFKAESGCPGCGSQVLAVHTYPCSACDNDLY